jgi:RNA polymerase primary sigma factor
MDDGLSLLVDLIEDEEALSPSDLVVQAMQRERIGEIFDEILTEREAEVLKLRFGLTEEGVAHTLEEIGEKLGVSRERVRQVETNALKKVKTEIERENSELQEITNNEMGL